MDKVKLPRFLKLPILVYSDTDVEEANLSLNSSLEASEKFGYTPDIDLKAIYSQTDDNSEIMYMYVCETELPFLISIIPNYPIKRKGKYIDTCDLRFEKSVGKHYINSSRALIIGNPTEILEKIQTFLES